MKPVQSGAAPLQPCLRGMSALRPRKTKRDEPELLEQIAYFQFLSRAARRYPVLRWVFSVPNGAFMPPATSGKMAASGMRRGVWDTFIPVPRVIDGDSFNGAWIEFKYGKNTLTEPQKAFRCDVLVPGRFAWAVSYSWIDAARYTLQYLGITDERLWDELRMSTPGIASPVKKVGRS